MDVVVFGTGNWSSLVWYCLTHDSPYRVVAFAVDLAYLRAPVHEGLPVVAFESLHERYPPEVVRLSIPLSFRAINGLRRERYEQAKARGYGFVNYVSTRALVWPDLDIGENCLIFENAAIQPFARIGNNVSILGGAQLSHHCRVADHAFIAAGALLGGGSAVGEQAFVGMGAVLREGVHVAERCCIGAGAVVVAHTEADAVYLGVPAGKTMRSAAETLG